MPESAPSDRPAGTGTGPAGTPRSEPEPADTTDTDAADTTERARRADRATRGALAAVLGLEAVVTLLVPRALAFSDAGLGTAKTITLVVLAVVMIVAAAMVRRPWGIWLGSVLQVAFLLTGVWLWAMVIVAAFFAAVWVRVLFLRHDLVGTPGGWRMLGS